MSDAMLIVLGLLAEGGQYAYDLERRIEQRRLRAWTAVAFSSIYALLETAHKRGWVSSRQKAGEAGPKIRAYTLTAKGKQALHDAIKERLTQAAMPPAAPVLALMFSGVEERELLEQYAIACEAEANDAAQRLQAMSQAPASAMRDAIFERAIAFHRSEARWAREVLQRISREAPKTSAQ